ncbi:hypothetical protein VTL71DRAFT_10355 [Oculimacula yallundae]|uniref:2EXR domain-containing protein n=1 Tax=Oculimacula yallundae TaxID=86028 RepID=A0ABR4CSV1_9HELO
MNNNTIPKGEGEEPSNASLQLTTTLAHSSPSPSLSPNPSSPSPTQESKSKSKFPFSSLPPELRLQIYTHHITQTPLQTLRIKFRLPLHSTTLARNPAAFILAQPVPELEHVCYELRSEFEKAKMAIVPVAARGMSALLSVFEDQGFEKAWRRRVLFPGLEMVGRFCRAFGFRVGRGGAGLVREMGMAREMGVDTVAVRVRERDWVRESEGEGEGEGYVSMVVRRMVQVFETLRVVYLVGKMGEGEKGGLLGGFMRGLRSGGERGNRGVEIGGGGFRFL